MLTREELDFLRSQNLSAADVYDARGQSAATWKAKVRSAGLTVVLGAPCRNGGHRLRTRSGHCIQCDTSKLSYQLRHHSPGYVYIAGSRSAKLIKIGTAIDIEQRLRNLRNQAYGNVTDWAMLFWAKVANGGETEGKAIRHLDAFRAAQPYDKDGSQQEAGEMLRTTFTKALKAVADAIGDERPKELWRSERWKDFEF
jgi:hypothetical protein